MIRLQKFLLFEYNLHIRRVYNKTNYVTINRLFYILSIRDIEFIRGKVLLIFLMSTYSISLNQLDIILYM